LSSKEERTGFSRRRPSRAGRLNRSRLVRTGNGTRTVLNPEAEWIRVKRPELRIVKAAVFERAQTERVVRKRPGTPRER
jgi:hypothetical protein